MMKDEELIDIIRSELIHKKYTYLINNNVEKIQHLKLEIKNNNDKIDKLLEINNSIEVYLKDLKENIKSLLYLTDDLKTSFFMLDVEDKKLYLTYIFKLHEIVDVIRSLDNMKIDDILINCIDTLYYNNINEAYTLIYELSDVE